MRCDEKTPTIILCCDVNQSKRINNLFRFITREISLIRRENTTRHKKYCLIFSSLLHSNQFQQIMAV